MDRLASLAINDEGFVFDPTTGQSFNVNPTGLKILRSLIANQKTESIVQSLVSDYSLSPTDAERDLLDFLDQLKIHKLM